jgi:Trypsin-co-occurring domain 1
MTVKSLTWRFRRDVVIRRARRSLSCLGWAMPGERAMRVKLDDGGTMVVVAEPVGETLVAATDVVARLGTITSSIERVSRDVLDAVRRAGPTKATVELGFGLAVESGQVVALFGKGRGEASIRVILEWSRDRIDLVGEDRRPAEAGS